MATEVVPPIAEAHVRGRGGEIGLERQRTERGIGVAREAYRIAVASQSAPTVEDEGAALGAVVAHVVKEHMVAPEGLAQSIGIVTGEVLLPVNPPEVDALLLPLVDDDRREA